MASILLKDVPDELKASLQERAAQNRRSMAQEALVILERELRSVPPMEWHEPLKPLKPISNAAVLKAIRAGRK